MEVKYPAFRLVFDRKHVATKTHRGLVQLEVYYGGKRKWVGTGVRLFADQWNERRHVVRTSQMMELNERLDAIVQSAVTFSNDLIRGGESFDFAKLEKHLAAREDQADYIDYVIRKTQERPGITESTRKQHATLVGALRAFGRIKTMDDLTRDNIVAFDNFLRARGLAQPTIYNYHKRNKVYINQAIQEGLMTDNPYVGFKAERGKSRKRRYLTEEEIERIRTCEVPNASVERARDLFLFQSYTGLAYADIAKFNFARDVERHGARYIIRDRRVKTGEDYFVVLIQPAMEILERHKYVLPIISNQNYNIALKALAECACIGTRLTTHVARHTFAVFALNAGVKIEVVARMLGHTNIRTTQEYAKILSKTVEYGFDVIEQAVLHRAND